MHKTLNKKKFFAALVLLVPGLCFAQQRAALGPVERLDRTGLAITVSGQTFAVTTATKIAIDGRRVSLSRGLQLLSTENSVYVESTESGRDASLINIGSDRYVPGASALFVRGQLSHYASEEGRIRLDSLWVDVSSVDPEVLKELTVGLVVQVSGVQPVSNGSLVGPVQLSIGGSGVSTKSIGGSGVRAESIGGSGLRIESIGGSGVRAESIGGSGLRIESIGGSGVRAESIGGSGLRTESIGGSGVRAESIGGSGVRAESIGGSGVRTESIGGSVMRTESIGGSGSL